MAKPKDTEVHECQECDQRFYIDWKTESVDEECDCGSDDIKFLGMLDEL